MVTNGDVCGGVASVPAGHLNQSEEGGQFAPEEALPLAVTTGIHAPQVCDGGNVAR